MICSGNIYVEILADSLDWNLNDNFIAPNDLHEFISELNAYNQQEKLDSLATTTSSVAPFAPLATPVVESSAPTAALQGRDYLSTGSAGLVGELEEEKSSDGSEEGSDEEEEGSDVGLATPSASTALPSPAGISTSPSSNATASALQPGLPPASTASAAEASSETLEYVGSSNYSDEPEAHIAISPKTRGQKAKRITDITLEPSPKNGKGKGKKKKKKRRS